VVAVEGLNGGSRKGEDERQQGTDREARVRGDRRLRQSPRESDWTVRHAIRRRYQTIDDLVIELKTGNYEPVDFRPQRKVVPHAVAVETR